MPWPAKPLTVCRNYDNEAFLAVDVDSYMSSVVCSRSHNGHCCGPQANDAPKHSADGMALTLTVGRHRER